MRVSASRFPFSASLIVAVFLNGSVPARALAAGDANQDKPPMTLSHFDAPFTFTYLSWQDKIQVTGGRAVFKGLACNGGAGVNTNLDLSACADLTSRSSLR